MIHLYGKADHVPTEQVRAFLCATLALLGYHNRFSMLPLVVRLRKRIVYQGTECWGLYCGSDQFTPELFAFSGEILLRQDLTLEDMLTTCIHEVIHACIRFPQETAEKCTSTLTAKLKPDVVQLADILVRNTYQRAAFLAHTKLRYVALGPDCYDTSEDVPIGVTKYHKGKPRKDQP